MSVRALPIPTDRRPPAFFRGPRARYLLREPVAAFLKARARAADLHPVRVDLPGIAAAAVVAIVVVRDEATRLPAFLDHYRRLGVDHFLVIDNESADGTGALLARSTDVSMYCAEGSYRAAHYGNDWVNALLARHCVGKWVLYVDADEFLVCPDEERQDLQALTGALEARGTEWLNATMVDLYSDRPAEQNAYTAGQDPLEVCRLFDADGYERAFDPVSRVEWIKGGVRARLFFPDPWTDGPALNKTPLVRWRRSSCFLVSSHVLWTVRKALQRRDDAPRAALLHQRFLDLGVQRLTDDGTRAQHTGEYRAYAEAATASMVGPDTREYRGPADLLAAGLMTALPQD